MAEQTVVLLVDPDTHSRAWTAAQLRPMGYTVMEAGDGDTALRMMRESPVRVVLSELYLPTGSDDCVVHAIRRDTAHKRTRIAVYTHRSLAADREWAMRAGADAYLIKPTRPQRVRYVVSRLASSRPNEALTATASSPIQRRDSLGLALDDIEGGKLQGTSCIVFGRAWWDTLAAEERTVFRKRARTARVSLRSDSQLGNHFVEVRGGERSDIGLSTERPESPYRASSISRKA